MNQPPKKPLRDPSRENVRPDWQRPRGVAQGTWQYVNQRSIAHHYDDFVAGTPLCELDQQIIHQVFSESPSRCQQIIVDLGCGTGRTAIPLVQRGYDVVGIDLSESMLGQLVAKANRFHSSQPNPIGSVQPLRANLVELECLADQSIDHAVCLFSTLGMIAGHANRHRLLRHVARIVRPDGHLVVHVHHRWSALREPGGWKKLLRSWWYSLKTQDADFGDSVYQYRGLEEMFMHRFSRRELKKLLTSCGWKIDQLHLVSIDGATTVKSLVKAGGFIVTASNASHSSRRKSK